MLRIALKESQLISSPQFMYGHIRLQAEVEMKAYRIVSLRGGKETYLVQLPSNNDIFVSVAGENVAILGLTND